MLRFRIGLFSFFLIFSTSLANFLAPETEKWQNNLNQLFPEREIPTMTVVSFQSCFCDHNLHNEVEVKWSIHGLGYWKY
jgi:hypothetical protein